MKDAQTTLTIYMMMVVALSTTTNLILTPILAARRDRRLAAGTKEVAEQAEKVAAAVVEVKNDMSGSKAEVIAHRQEEKQIFSNLQNKVDATHIIVNAQKTAMMQKMANAQLGMLTMTQAMLEEKPNSAKLKQAVAVAQALYDESLKDLQRKEAE